MRVGSDLINHSALVLGSTEQLVVTSIKHEDGSPPTNIIKKEPTPSSSTGSGASSSSNVNSNDSNNNNDTNDNKNSNSSGNPLLPDEKDPTNDNSITDECKLRNIFMSGKFPNDSLTFLSRF